MTQTAAAGTFSAVADGYVLRMTDVSPITVVFSERPERNGEAIPTQQFVDQWDKAFASSPPNGAIVLTGADASQDTLVVELTKPTYDANQHTLTYHAKVARDAATGGLAEFGPKVDDRIPPSFGNVSLFIDGTRSSSVLGSTSTTTLPTSCSTQGSPTEPVRMQLVNQSDYPDDKVYVALTGTVLTGYTSWDANPKDLINASVPLSCLPVDPTDPSGHTHYFDLGKGIGAGLLWVSLDAPVTSGLPTTQPSFDTTPYRFANVEFAYPGQGDMTNVDQFSFPINLDTYTQSDAAPTATPISSTSYSSNTCGIVQALKQSIDDYNASPASAVKDATKAKWSQVVVTDASGGFVRVVSPKQRAGQLPASPYAQGWPSLLPYIDSLAGQQITVKGLFTPGASSSYYDQTGWYDYTGTLEDGVLTLNGSIGAPVSGGPTALVDVPATATSTTVPTTTGLRAGKTVTVAETGTDTVAPPTGETTPIVVGTDGLDTGVYNQNARYTVGGTPRNGLTNGQTEEAAPDDVYNSIYRDLVTAFTYGYWNGSYGNDNSSFWGTFATGQAPSGGQASFASARPSTGDPFLAWNLFSQVMFGFSDNYNIPYGEDYGSGAADRSSPLLDIPNSGTWRMTIKPDGFATPHGAPTTSPPSSASSSSTASPDPTFECAASK